MSIQTFETKLADETITISFEFTNRLATGESITAGACVAEVFSGTDASPSSIISGAATLSGAIVSQVITGGLAGVVYLISCEVDTDDSNVLINQGRIAVVAENPYV